MAQQSSDPSYRHCSKPQLFPRFTSQFIACLSTCLFLTLEQGYATVFEISPTNADTTCEEQFENAANTLKPGDELVLHGGTYSQSCRRAITVNGTAASPIIIRAAAGEHPLLTRTAASSAQENNIDIDQSSYLIIRGLRFQGGDSGVRLIGGHHITIEDAEIFDTLNNGLRANTGSTDRLTFRHNHIHHTGLNLTVATEGEGMYLGCNNNTCQMTNSLIENNYIHHLRSTSQGGNDGIEVKVGSAGNIIRDNVIHDTTIGTRYPCILVYGGGAAVNTVEGNIVWNCGEGIYAVSDAIVRNNIILNSDNGISSYPHQQVAQMKNLTIVNNTVYGGPECLLVRWGTVKNGVLANNAGYCPGGTAVNATGLNGTGLTIRANYVTGNLNGVAIDNVGFFSGGTAVATFVNPAGSDFWPTASSVLLGKADASVAPPKDFNDALRTSPFDVGAYERGIASTNSGWKIVAGFKTIAVQAPPIAPTSLVVH